MENQQIPPANTPVANPPPIEQKSNGLKNLFRTLFGHSAKRTFLVIGGLIVVLSIPLTMLLISQQQDLRQRAEFSSNTSTNTFYGGDDRDDDNNDWSGGSGSNCSSSSSRGSGCSCYSDSQCSSRDCSNNKCTTGSTSGSNCSSSTSRGEGCSCSYDGHCATRDCRDNRCTGTTSPTPTTNNCSSSTSRGENCSCTSDSQCSSRDCENNRCEGGSSGTNCSSTSSRGEGCSCSSDSQCSTRECTQNKCVARITGTITPTKTPTPSPAASCNSSTNKPDNCSCNYDSQCASKDCTGSVLQKGVCKGGPTPSVAPSVTVKPTNPPVDVCAASKYRAQNCSCTQNSQCRSGVCASGTCAVGAKDVVPTGSTGLKLAVKIPGIGAKTATVDDNPSPKNSSRVVRAILLDNNNNPVNLGGNDVAAGSGVSLHFDSSNYSFSGPINLGTSLETGNYLVKLSVDNSLFRQIPGIVTITKGNAENATATITLVSGDMNGDNTLGVSDWTNMIACMRNEAACTGDMKALSDLNDNGETDVLDIQLLQRGFARRDGD